MKPLPLIELDFDRILQKGLANLKKAMKPRESSDHGFLKMQDELCDAVRAIERKNQEAPFTSWEAIAHALADYQIRQRHKWRVHAENDPALQEESELKQAELLIIISCLANAMDIKQRTQLAIAQYLQSQPSRL